MNTEVTCRTHGVNPKLDMSEELYYHPREYHCNFDMVKYQREILELIDKSHNKFGCHYHKYSLDDTEEEREERRKKQQLEYLAAEILKRDDTIRYMQQSITQTIQRTVAGCEIRYGNNVEKLEKKVDELISKIDKLTNAQ